jgi:hypothetical protein
MDDCDRQAGAQNMMESGIFIFNMSPVGETNRDSGADLQPRFRLLMALKLPMVEGVPSESIRSIPSVPARMIPGWPGDMPRETRLSPVCQSGRHNAFDGARNA